ncbi:MAG: hypothetical protein EA352_05685 [Gemmatimonadales bacterium]|nr:MAG: hypothetical protein EA352_05685 [Gemmatimonadales bacterium]
MTPVVVGSLPLSCYPDDGGAIHHQGRIIVAGLLKSARCETYVVGEEPEFESSLDPFGPAPAVFLEGEGLTPSEREAPPFGSENPVTFVFPVHYPEGGWGLVWGEAVAPDSRTSPEEGWPVDWTSRVLASEFHDGHWQPTETILSEDRSLVGRPGSMRNLVTRDGQTTVLLTQTFHSVLSYGGYPGVVSWTTGGDPAHHSFPGQLPSLGGQPSLGLDGAGDLWLSWADTTDAGDIRLHVHRLGPDGLDDGPPAILPATIEERNDVADLAVFFDGADGMHLFWTSVSGPRPRYVARASPESEWEEIELRNPSSGTPIETAFAFAPFPLGETGEMAVGLEVVNPQAPHGAWLNVEVWTRLDGEWVDVLESEGDSPPLTRAVVPIHGPSGPCGLVWASADVRGMQEREMIEPLELQAIGCRRDQAGAPDPGTTP